MKRPVTLLWFVLALTVAPWAVAQRFDEAVEVTVVEVPVTVVDSAGKPVRGLTKDDFEIFDDGKRATVEHFEVLDMKLLPASSRERPLPPAASRNFLLLFDLANSDPAVVVRAAEAAASFVKTQLGEHDLAAVATFTAEDGAKIIANFTSDRALLEAAIATVHKPQYFKVADPLMISFDTTSIQIPDVPAGGMREEAGIGPGERGAMINEMMQDSAEERNVTAQRSQDSEQANRLRVQLSNLGLVARMLDRLYGRKEIIFLSEGFDSRLVLGRENVGGTKSVADRDAALAGEVWKLDSDQRFGNTGAARDVRDMVELFRRSDVVLHAIDIRGLRGGASGNMAGAAPGGASDGLAENNRRSNESLFLITRPTGGHVFRNSNDLQSMFAKMMERQEVVYLLGFNATATGEPGRFHSLKVKAKGRGLTASHRTGYYEGAPATSIERSLSTAEVLLNDIPLRDVEVSIAATAFPDADGKALVPVIVEIPGTKMLEGVRRNTATATVFLYAFDETNQVRDFVTQRLALDLSKVGDALRATGIRYYGTLRLPAGRFAVKAVVRVEDTARAGFARYDLTVPDFLSPVVLPPLMVDEGSDWMMISGGSRGGDAAWPFSIGETRYVPMAHRELRGAGEYDIALFLHDVPAEGLGITSSVTGADGGGARSTQLALVGRTADDGFGGSRLLFRFRPGQLPAGAWELRMAVTPKGGSESLVRLPFVMQ